MTPAIAKELRALLPMWSACILVVGTAALARDMGLLTAAVLTYGFGCVVLGAQSVGHEYGYGTLTTLLAQPIDRRRVWVIKMIVLAAMLAVLTALAIPTLFGIGVRVRAVRMSDITMLYLAAAAGLLLAPYLTMVCRSALGGVVFTVAIPGLLLVLGDLLGMYWYGLRRAGDIDRFKYALFWRAMFAVLAFGAIAGWRRFTRLEARDGHGAQIDLPRLFSRHARAAEPRRGRRQRAVWGLVAKELRLQQMTFVIVAIYVAFWLTAPGIQNDAIFLYAMLLSALIGALPSAEERLFGTHEWQILQPVAGRRQWAIKAGVAIGLALLLGAALPAVLNSVLGVGGQVRFRSEMWAQLVATIVVATACALYVSSLSTSGVRALAISFPVIAGGVILAKSTLTTIAWLSRHGWIPSLPGGLHLSHGESLMALALVSVPLVALALHFAQRNHCSLERSTRRVLTQGAWLLGYVVVASAVLVGFG